MYVDFEKYKSLVLVGAEVRYAAELIETLERSGIGVAGAICLQVAEWDLAGLPSFDWEDFPERLLSLPYLVPNHRPQARKRILKKARAKGFSKLCSLFDPTAVLAKSADLKPGSYLNANTVVGANCRFGEAVFVNRLAGIGHDSVLEDYVSIGPGVSMASNCMVGHGTIIGAGASIAPGVRIGAKSVVASGTSVHIDVPDNVLVAGNPCTIKNQISKSIWE
jgi:acetyltransferase-like isoleucine patch superfamily enzyme